MGLGVSKFAKDYKNPKTGNGSDGRFMTVGKNRRLVYLARFSELSVERLGNKIKKFSGENEAFKNDITMADMLAKDYLRGDKAPAALSSLDILDAVKKAIEKDEAVLKFDIMDLYLRCIHLLCDIQTHCLNNAPHDFPKAIYDKGLGMNAVINELLWHCSGAPRHHPFMFPDAVNMLRQVIDTKGSVVLDKAEAQKQSHKLTQLEPDTELESSFENPVEGTMSLQARNLFGTIIMQDENGDCRMPFGRGR